MDWLLAGQVTLVGLVTVSIVLAAMIGGLHLIGYVARFIDSKKSGSN